MQPKAYVYTELQLSVPFEDAPWRDLNPELKKQPGFINKTWLSGVTTNTVGGFYAFDSVNNAEAFVTGYFPKEAAKFGVAHMTRVFDASIVEQASRELASPHYT